MRELNTKDFNYDLPNHLIAQTPSDKRQNAKLFVYNGPGQFEHKVFSDILDHIPDESVIVRNNTKVFASRIIGKKNREHLLKFFY